MRAIFEQISASDERSIRYRQFSNTRFDAPFHFHPALELTYIEQGQGRRLVGRQVANFESGDLVLLGPNLPHTWLTEPSEVQGQQVYAWVIQFQHDFAGPKFWEMPEMGAIRSLFQKAGAGIWVKGNVRQAVAEKMKNGLNASPLQQFLLLIEILQMIALSNTLEQIDPQFLHFVPSAAETERFQRVYAYLIAHYREDISLEQMAAVANLTPSSFCRYFKKITRKTLVDVLTEFRVKHACQLLTTTDKPVADICFESGFGNVSYFNQEFKKAMGCNPLAYKKFFGV
jgi:AraC-like DNA-binding protein